MRILLLPMALLVLGGRLPAQSVSCPASIRVDEKLAAPVEGWQAGRLEVPHRLSAVTFFEGKPSEGASLVFDNKRDLPKEWIATWNLVKGRQYWLQCSYSGTTITLSRQLPGASSSCAVTYSRVVSIAGSPEIKSILCR